MRPLRATLTRAVAVAVLLSAAAGTCNNRCSGNGLCGINDICTCFANWMGGDCSERRCPYGNAWVGDGHTPGAFNHGYAECSNRGTCKRRTGMCKCLDGYTGSACARVICGNSKKMKGCHGHGRCMTLSDLAIDAGNHAAYAYWDAHVMRECLCDHGFTGADCSLRSCPLGTPGSIGDEAPVIAVSDAQNVTVQARAGLLNGGEVAFTYQDLYNTVWTTRPVRLPQVKVWSNTGSEMTAAQFNWVDTGKSLSSASSVEAIGTTEDVTGVPASWLPASWTGLPTAAASALKHTLAAGTFDGAGAAYVPRKGDWVLLSSADGAKQCSLHVHSDLAAASGTSFLASIHGTQGTAGSRPAFAAGTCRLASSDLASCTLRTAWTAPLVGDTASIDGTSKSVTAFDAATGVLTLDAGAGDALRQKLFPGSWVRIYDESEPRTGDYCDMQVRAQPTGDTSIAVNPVSPTSTLRGDPGTGMSAACSSFAGKTYALAHLAQHNVLASATSRWPATAAMDKFATAGGFLTRADQSNAPKVFTAADRDFLRPGALVFVVDAASFAVRCAGVVSREAAGDALPLEPLGAAGVGGNPNIVQCSALESAAASAELVVFGSNSIGLSASPSRYLRDGFGDLGAGDWLAVSGAVARYNDDLRTLRVERVAARSLESNRSLAVFFSTGSMPNGGGMFPIVARHSALSAAVTGHYPTKAGAALGPGATVQVYHAATCAWCGRETAILDSASTVRRVLKELPNHVVKDVSVAMTSNSLTLYAYTISFPDVMHSGKRTVVMHGEGCRVSGCQPFYSGVRTQQSFSLGAAKVTPATTSASSQPVPSTIADTGSEGVAFDQYVASTEKDVVRLFHAEQTADTGEEHVATAASATAVSLRSSASVITGVVGIHVLKARGADGPVHGLGIMNDAAYFDSATIRLTPASAEKLPVECSGQGICNADLGFCKCDEGYTGADCRQQVYLEDEYVGGNPNGPLDF